MRLIGRLQKFGCKSTWRTLPLISLLVLSTATFSTSYASKKDDEGCRGNCGGDAANNITSNIGVESGQEQSQSQSNSSTNTNSNTNTSGSSSSASQSLTGNSQTVNVTDTSPDDITIRNVASPDTPNPYPTAPCRVGVSAGLSLAGGAFSGGGSVEDEECTLRETARSFKDLGVPELGLILLCEKSEVITGKKNKKGELEAGEVAFGSQRCLDLVSRYLERPDDAEDGDGAAAASASATADLARQLDVAQTTASMAVMEVEQLRELVERSESRQPPPPQIIRQEYLSESKKAALAALLTDEESQ